MCKLKIAGLALLYFGFLLPSFSQDATAFMFAKQVERDIAALSSQPSVGEWQKIHPDEKLELVHYDRGKGDYADDLGLDFDSWCAGSISQSPSAFGRVALFFLPGVRAGALPPLPRTGMASVETGCHMQVLHYSIPPQTPIEDVIREFSSLWGTPDRSHAISASEFGHPEMIAGDVAIWDHRELRAGLWIHYASALRAGRAVPESIVLYVKSDALPAEPCPECTSSLIYPLFGEKLTLFVQSVARIAAQDPDLTRQIIEWSGHVNDVRKTWIVDPSVARNNLRKWLDVAEKRSLHERAAGLLLADFYVAGTPLGNTAKPYIAPAEVYKPLGAEFDEQGNYLSNFRKQAEKLDDGGEVSEMAALWTLGGECPGFDKRPWPDIAIEHVESFLARFPSDRWTPFVDFALARAHSAKLLWTYPGGRTDDYSIEGSPLSATEKERERAAAVESFNRFLNGEPSGRSAAFAWLEAWRLLAGLPPSTIGWGCTGE